MKRAKVLVVFIGIAAIISLVLVFGAPQQNPDHVEYVGAALIDLFYDNIAAFNRLRDVIPRNLDANDQLWVSQNTIHSSLEWTDCVTRHEEQDFPQEVITVISTFFEEMHCDRIIWYGRVLKISFYPDDGFFCYFYDEDAVSDALFSRELQEGWYWCTYPDGCIDSSD